MTFRKNRIFLGIGSNVGDSQAHLQECIERLIHIPGLIVNTISSIYETEPVGMKNQENFLNAAVEIEYKNNPYKLLIDVKALERSMGRWEVARWGPRIIDVDIIYFGSVIINSPDLTIPHMEIGNRQFVLTPLEEIASDFHCPVTKLTIAELRNSCNDVNKVVIQSDAGMKKNYMIVSFA